MPVHCCITYLQALCLPLCLHRAQWLGSKPSITYIYIYIYIYYLLCIIYYLFFIICYLLFVIYYSLFIICYLLFVIYYLLFISFYLVFMICYLLCYFSFITYYLLFIIYYSSFIIYCLLLIIYYLSWRRLREPELWHHQRPHHHRRLRHLGPHLALRQAVDLRLDAVGESRVAGCRFQCGYYEASPKVDRMVPHHFPPIPKEGAGWDPCPDEHAADHKGGEPFLMRCSWCALPLPHPPFRIHSPLPLMPSVPVGTFSPCMALCCCCQLSTNPNPACDSLRFSLLLSLPLILMTLSLHRHLAMFPSGELRTEIGKGKGPAERLLPEGLGW